MGCFLPSKLYGVIGWPLGQTLSPLLHNTGFQSLGLPCVYMAWPVKPEDLEKFVDSLAIMNIQGLSITIPHKIAILRYLENVSEAASLAGAVNTLFWRNNELCGDNTDVTGFMAPLADLTAEKLDVLLLGAGGAAHAAAAGLRLAGCANVRVTSPGDQRQYALAERFSYMPIRWNERYSHAATLVINATPIGMTGSLAGESPYDFSLAPAVNNGIAYDLVYNPLETEFLKQAAKAGRRCISGLEMFIGQGNAQFQIWTGQPLPTDARQAVAKALGQVSA